MPRTAQSEAAFVSTDREEAFASIAPEGFRLYEVLRDGTSYYVKASGPTAAKQAVASRRGDSVKCLEARKGGRTGPRDPKKLATTFLAKISPEERKQILAELAQAEKAEREAKKPGK